MLILFLLFLGILSYLTWLDLKYGYLPDGLNFSLLWLGLLANPLLHFVNLYAAILGVVFGYMGLWFVYQVHKYISHMEGMGFGDFKLLAALGAWFGWQTLPLLLLIATGGTLSILMELKLLDKYPLNPQIPLGPGLCLAGVIIFLAKYLTIG